MLKRLRKKPFPYRSAAWSAEYARLKAILPPSEASASAIRRMITATNLSHIAYPMHMEQCGAYCRTTGKPCQALALTNGRCRMHGGSSIQWTEQRRAATMASKIKRLASKASCVGESTPPPPEAEPAEF